VPADLRWRTIDERLLASLTFSGELLRPGDPGYDEARRVHNGMIDKRPALVARCRDAADVAAAVDLARDEGLELSVRGGGHNVAGTAVTDGGVMVDLSRMRFVEVDPTHRRARVGGGATWGDVDWATQAHGLAVTGGMISTTGVGGLTLGGGLGWLMGKYGLTADSLVGADLVNADGRRLAASAAENDDLLWALRGGGGNFGVVTTFEFELHEVGPAVTAVSVAFPFERAGEVLRAYRTVTAEAPDELTLNAALRRAADGSGARLAGVSGCHLGDRERALRDLRPLLELGTPVELEIGPAPYTAVNSAIDAAYPRGALNYWKSSFLRDLSDDAIDTMVAGFATCPSPLTVFVLEHLHGQVTRVPVTAAAVPHREPGYNFLATSVWLDPGASAENVEWTRAAFAALQPYAARRRYSNYIAADELGEDPVRQAYGPNYERLVELKTKYDPANLFRLNQNVRPRGS
jgi:FAD/FMN-containing dehydrogenase